MGLKLIKQKDFSLLIIGKLISLLGSNMQQFALSLYVLTITGSVTVFASILSVSIIPRVILSPIAGVFGDWFDRKKSIVLLDFINSVIIGVFAAIYIANGHLSIPLIYFLVILLEVTEIFFHSAMSAVLPSIVDKEDYLEANSLNSVVMNIGNILAPIFAAFLYGIFGIKIVLIVNSISFMLSAISKVMISIPKSTGQPEKINIKSFKTDFREGINIIKSNKFLSTMIGLGTMVNFAASPLYSIVIIYFLKEVLLVSDVLYGIFQMVFSASMLAAPILCGKVIRSIKIGRIIYKSFMIISILIFIMAIFTSNYVVTSFNTIFVSYFGVIVLSFFIGMVVTVANIALSTLFDKVVPLNVMGRTSTVFNFSVTVFIPLGQMIVGFLLDFTMPSIVVSIIGFVVLMVILKYKYTLMDYDKLSEGEAVNDF